ncbi:HU family DNA-binding protein [Prevotella sp. E15-22]|jgi:DNA-binding protein HU-beta/integration host factor subunit alpha|uniref:HU family DNA-binding protein n=1 Tax=Prevotella sp. E15-22 TaxID=2937774 RepID=UPI002051F55F|nr:HU family DNA-binding protein [Prevotella sp. E15-22]UPS45725.1 HU family DNA-binding protein [Prevotella sp. E15-22]
MNNKEFVTLLAGRTGMKVSEAQKTMESIISIMGDCFQEGDTVQMANFGTFEVKKKLERIMVSPTTGQRMLVPPKLALTFKPNPTWKDMIKKGGTE